MKVLIFAFASSFTENLNYKENYYVKLFSNLGHQVIVYTNNCIIDNGKIVTVEESVENKKNFTIIRKRYKFLLSSFFSKKIRMFKDFYRFLNEMKPDLVITFGLQSFDLITLAKYKNKINRNMLLICESHEDFNNSARTFFSKFFLHQLIYKSIINLSLKQIDFIFYITYETKLFLTQFYKLKLNKLVYSPLGGLIPSEQDYNTLRIFQRSEFQIKHDQVLFFHSGKIDKSKNTIELIKSFKKLHFEKIKLYIAGSIDPSIETQFFDLIENDSRIKFIGWLNDSKLLSVLAATDVYIQPGSQSATFQVAACMRCGLIAYDHLSYRNLFNQNILYIKSEKDIIKNISLLMSDTSRLQNLKKSSFHVAEMFLNYESQISFILNLYKSKLKTKNNSIRIE